MGVTSHVYMITSYAGWHCCPGTLTHWVVSHPSISISMQIQLHLRGSRIIIAAQAGRHPQGSVIEPPLSQWGGGQFHSGICHLAGLEGVRECSRYHGIDPPPPLGPFGKPPSPSPSILFYSVLLLFLVLFFPWSCSTGGHGPCQLSPSWLLLSLANPIKKALI